MFPVRRIETPHEAELDELAAARHLRRDHTEAFLRTLRQGFFAKDGLADFDRGER
jgi:hypothetical protein